MKFPPPHIVGGIIGVLYGSELRMVACTVSIDWSGSVAEALLRFTRSLRVIDR